MAPAAAAAFACWSVRCGARRATCASRRAAAPRPGSPLRAARRLVVAEGLLLRALRRWLPKVPSISLGEALTMKSAIRDKLRADDLYVIEPRAFHHDHARLVGHYDGLRAASGCEMNLDLQRIAIPASQAQWILEGRQVARIVVEDVNDGAAFSFAAAPVIHVADL